MQANLSRVLKIGVGLVCLGQLCISGCTSSTVYDGHDYRFSTGLGAEGQAEASGDRELMIEAIREVLTDHRFVIDRVDARRGVVTTEVKTTQGIGSPWDSEQGSLTQETADFVNQHERAVRVLIEESGEIVVSVMVQRVHRPGWRVETESIASSSHYAVIGSDGRRESSRMVTPIGNDGLLAERIGEAIRARLAKTQSNG